MAYHLNIQQAPYPTELADLVSKLTHRPDWTFELMELERGQGSTGLTLVVGITAPDSYNHAEMRTVNHYFIVPAAAYDRRSWQRWLLEQLMLVDVHEACENFQIDGVRPYAPSHGFGQDPYMIRELGTSEDQRTSYLNKLKPE